MEFYYPTESSWPFFPPHPFFLSSLSPTSQNNNSVRWVETPDAHLFRADLPGVRKEEIRVEVEDSRYMVIRTELTADGEAAAEREREPPSRREFMRKFRLPEMVDLDGIAATYEDGVLTVTVPRSVSRRRLLLDPADVADGRNSVARAA